jgi:hypothetical protein
MLYTLFIDEAGDHRIQRCHEYRKRFLSLTGILVSRQYSRDVLIPELAQLKEKYIGDSDISLHRSDIIGARNGFEPLEVAAVRNAFDADLLDSLTKWDFKMWSVCIDKHAHVEKYQAWVYPPYHYCLALLLERTALYLNRFGHSADVVVEARFKSADRQLQDQYNRLYRTGTDYVGVASFQKAFTNSQLKMKPKTSNYAGLQLADIVAYPSKQEIIIEHGMTFDSGDPVTLAPFSTKICGLIGNKYDQWNGNIYGKKFI